MPSFYFWGVHVFSRPGAATLIRQTNKFRCRTEVGPATGWHGGSLTWLAGETCADWELASATSPTIETGSDMLSDTQVTAGQLNPKLAHHIMNAHCVLSCGIAVRAPMVVVDDRMLITTSPSQQSYLILEKVDFFRLAAFDLAPEEVAGWQSDHAADCNSAYADSIPTPASI